MDLSTRKGHMGPKIFQVRTESFEVFEEIADSQSVDSQGLQASIQNPGTRNPNPNPNQQPATSNQNPESRIQNPESRIQNPESRNEPRGIQKPLRGRVDAEYQGKPELGPNSINPLLFP